MTTRLVELGPDDVLRGSALPVLQELRPHLTRELLARVLREGAPQGLRFTAVVENGRCVAVWGSRIIFDTYAIRRIHVDYLSTTASERSRGNGATLLRSLVQRARDLGCQILTWIPGFNGTMPTASISVDAWTLEPTTSPSNWPRIMSNTSVCLTIVDPEVTAGGGEATEAFSGSTSGRTQNQRAGVARGVESWKIGKIPTRDKLCHALDIDVITQTTPPHYAPTWLPHGDFRIEEAG